MKENGLRRADSTILHAMILTMAVALLGLVTSSAWAARPFYATESADPVEKGRTRFETGFLWQQFSSNDRLSTLLVDLTNGMLNDFDFEVEAPILFLQSGNSAENGLGDVSLKTKVRWMRAREGRPVSLATQFVVKLPTCDKSRLAAFNPSCTDKADVGVVGIASKAFRSVDVHLNVGYTMVGGDTVVPPALVRTRSLRDTLSYSVGFVMEPAPLWQVSGEVAGNTSADPADSIHPLIGLVAVGYQVQETVTVDAGIGRGFTSSAPQIIVSAGATIRF